MKLKTWHWAVIGLGLGGATVLYLRSRKKPGEAPALPPANAAVSLPAPPPTVVEPAPVPLVKPAPFAPPSALPSSPVVVKTAPVKTVIKPTPRVAAATRALPTSIRQTYAIGNYIIGGR